MASELFDQHVVMSISADKLRATLRILPGIPPQSVELAAVDALLSERDVWRSFVDRAAVRTVIDRYAANPDEPAEAVIARGVPPTHGENGRFEPTPEIVERRSCAQKTADAAEGNSVDHYSHSAFVIVEAGELLGYITDPTLGSDGTDVCGQTIPAHPGRRCEIRTDASVHRRPGGPVVSRLPGQLHLTSIDLRVNTQLDIAENIDFSTGHVRFPGPIIVRGGIKDRFEVECGKAIRVLGLVEAATVRAHLDVDLAIGMAGRERGTIHAGRDLRAGYLDSVTAKAGRDCIVANEISNSTITVGRTLRITGGTIRGGTISCGVSCEASLIGSAGREGTTLIIGSPEHIPELAREMLDSETALDEILSSAKTRLTLLNAGKGRRTPSQAEEICTFDYIAQTAQNALKRIRDARTALGKVLGAMPMPSLTVGRALQRSSVVTLGPYTLRPKDDMKGPFQLLLPPSGQPEILDTANRKKTPAKSVMTVTRHPDAVDLRDFAIRADANERLAA